MGLVVKFSEVGSYLAGLSQDKNVFKGVILDTNVLITASYDVRDDHSEVSKVLDALREFDFRLFATVNTKAEFLEFHRRLILSENLLDAVDVHSILKLPKEARAKIQTLNGSLTTTMRADPERDKVFNDSQLKKIKQEFSAGDNSAHHGWLEFCELFLKDKVSAIEASLDTMAIEYISPNLPDYSSVFPKKIEWSGAVALCEKTSISLSDAMILNAHQSSLCRFIVSRDFDMGYAVLADSEMKDALVPDRLARE